MSLKKIRRCACLFLILTSSGLLHSMFRSNIYRREIAPSQQSPQKTSENTREKTEGWLTKLWKWAFATQKSSEIKTSPEIKTKQAFSKPVIERLQNWREQVVIKASDGTVSVPMNLIKQSLTIQGMFEDLGVLFNQELSLPNFSIETIQNCMQLLKLYSLQGSDHLKSMIKSYNYSLEQIINLANCADYFDIPIQEIINNYLITFLNSTTLDNLLEKPEIISSLYTGPKKIIIKTLRSKLKSLFISKENIESIKLEKNCNALSFRPTTKTFVCSDNISPTLFAKTIQDDGTSIDAPLAFDKDHTGFITNIVFSNDGKKMVSSSRGNSKSLIAWSFNNNNITSQYLDGHQRFIKKIVLSPNSKILASSSDDNSEFFIWILDDTVNIQPKSLKYENLLLKPIAFSHDSQLLMCSNDHGSLYVIEFDSNNNIISDPKLISSGNPQLPYYREGIFHPHYRKFFTNNNKSLILYDLSNMNNIIFHSTAITFYAIPTAIMVDSSGDLLAGVSREARPGSFLENYEINLIDINAEKIIKKITSIGSELSFSDNGEYLINHMPIEGFLHILIPPILQKAIKDLNNLNNIELIILNNLIDNLAIISKQPKDKYVNQLKSIPKSIKELLKHMQVIELPISHTIIQTSKAETTQKNYNDWQAKQLENKKVDMRRYFDGPHLKTVEARTQAITTLKNIYKGIEKKAFEEVVKEMGLSHLLE